MWGDAYWYNYKSQELIKVPKGYMHADYVVENPEKFKVEQKSLDWAMDGLDDGDLSWLMLEVMKKGWFRVHKFRDLLSIDMSSLSNRAKDGIYDLLKKMSVGPDHKLEISQVGVSHYMDKPLEVTARYFFSGEAFNESLKEGKDTNFLRSAFGVAIWYNPKTDKIVGGSTKIDTHTAIIRDNPDVFGLSPEDLYNGTPEGWKNQVRDNGWYQVHFYPGYITIHFASRFDKKAKENIYDLLTKLRIDPSVEITIEHRLDYEVLKAEDFYGGGVFESKLEENYAYWFDSNRNSLETVPASWTHSQYLYAYPEKFGYEKAKIDRIGYGEVSSSLMRKGWIQVHVYPNYVAINVYKYNASTQYAIFDLIHKLNYLDNKKIVISAEHPSHFYLEMDTDDLLSGKMSESKFKRLLK